MSYLAVQSLRVGTEHVGRATLSLQRDSRGRKSWHLSGEADGLGPLPPGGQAVAKLDDGRELTGQVFLTFHRIEPGRDLTLTYAYRGSGPLDGTTEGDYG